ncbi:prephenate dehydratase domain-containing protein, partial [Veillonella sp.]|uniref:prephenate dehydratase domain-containing protein n=1 Tax=Veillonella sp. TaxID=1926307 RepID=UPI00257C835D
RLWISHDLLVKKGTKLEDIHTIISHPQALGQCSHFLEKLEGVELRSFDNTARAAQLVAASDDPGVAAIAAPQCADLYNLSPLMRNIQNSDNNYTRFICISKDFHVYPGANKISVVTTASHAPGGLGTLLTKFANIGVNLTKLESRPIVGHNFEFLFYNTYSYKTSMANRYQPISHSMYIDLGGPMKFGLLGRTLGHSFSPRIHSALGNTNYKLFEREPSQLQEFFADPELQGINITIPYKVNALEACDVVDPRAERIGCVNTMVRKDGKWHGYNTDYDGFVFTLPFT